MLTSLHFIARGSIEIIKDDVVMAILGTINPIRLHAIFCDCFHSVYVVLL